MRHTLSILLVSLLLVGGARPSCAFERISENVMGRSAAINRDGRYVAFESSGSVYLRDRQTGEFTRIGRGYSPVISGDGQLVAFVSIAADLVSGDTNGQDDIFVYQHATGQITRVSVASDGAQGNNHSDEPRISADGRYVVFASLATTLVAGDTNNTRDVFLHDRQTHETRRVSCAADGVQGNGESSNPTISGDGRWVAFSSRASNLVADDTNGKVDIFLLDRQSGPVTRASVSGTGAQGNGDCRTPVLNADGRYLAFESAATNLVVGDTNSNSDVFLLDRQTGGVSREGIVFNRQPNYGADSPVISDDGRFVAFHSLSTHVGVDEVYGSHDVFLHDRATDQVVRCRPASSDNIRYLHVPALSGDGTLMTVVTHDKLTPGQHTDIETPYLLHAVLLLPPTPVDDAYSMQEDTTLSVPIAGVLANDPNPSVQPLSAGERSYGAEIPGVLSLGGQGGFTYTPPQNWQGIARFTYRVSYGALWSAPATVTITVRNVSDPPLAVNDTFTTTINTPVVISAPGVLRNDVDPDGDPLTVTPLTTTTYGQLTIQADGSFRYVPATGWSGVDGFTYQIGDGRETSAATVTFLVLAPMSLTRVSRTLQGRSGNGASRFPAVSANGRYIAFESAASDLVVGDTNACTDVFVHDRATAITARVSLTSTGIQGNGESYDATISGDGRYIAFTSAATNLVAGDTNGMVDVFLHDRTSVRTLRVSYAFSSRQQGDGESYSPAISRDGKVVVFVTAATNLVPILGADTNGFFDIYAYVHDGLMNGNTMRVSKVNDAFGNGHSYAPAVSGDGRYIAYLSSASNMVLNDSSDTNGLRDVFVKDRISGLITRVSVSSAGNLADGDSGAIAISDDGRYVAFESSATNLVGDDTNGKWDIFLHDRQTMKTVRMSIASDGREGNESSFAPTVSGDGRFVAFHSLATNFCEDTNGVRDIFVHDRLARHTLRVSLADNGTPSAGDCLTPVFSADGYVLAFASVAANLGPWDANGTWDVFTVRVPGQAVPSVTADHYDVLANGVLTVPDPGVLSNDADVNADPLRASVNIRPAHGTLILAPGGGFTYTPAPGWTGVDSFTYAVSDGVSATSPLTTVALTVWGITGFGATPERGMMGAPSTLTASAPPGAAVEYLFRAGMKSGTTWQWATVRPYAPVPTCAWTPSTTGNWTLVVWARLVGSPRQYDTYIAIPYQVGAGLSAVALATAPRAPQPLGTPVTLTAQATGGGEIEYRFRAGHKSGTGWFWSDLTGYQRSATCEWTPASVRAWALVVWARQVGSPRTYDVYTSVPYSVHALPPTGVTLTVTPQSGRVRMPVELRAQATGGTSVHYRFRVGRRVGSTFLWQTVRDWAATPSAIWTPQYEGAYILAVYAKETGSPKEYDVYAAATYMVDEP
jgi:Tol biopolymer transport system component